MLLKCFCIFSGFNPRWDETFKFQINHPELCIVRFTVKDYDLAGDDFIGYYALPFNCMQEGKSAGSMNVYIICIYPNMQCNS